VGARRLHDIGRSGWWQLLVLIPLIGAIVLIVWFAQKGDPSPNEYGPNPWHGPQPVWAPRKEQAWPRSHEDGNGLLRDGRLCQLVREREAVRERTLKITFLEPGAEAYAFTFG
jgi:hypothetical protein